MFRGSDALADGLLSPKALRGPGWTRLRYDMFADSRLEHDHELACRAAALVLPESAVIAGRSAAFLLGVEHAASFADDVCVILPPDDPIRGTNGRPPDQPRSGRHRRGCLRVAATTPRAYGLGCGRLGGPRQRRWPCSTRCCGSGGHPGAS